MYRRAAGALAAPQAGHAPAQFSAYPTGASAALADQQQQQYEPTSGGNRPPPLGANQSGKRKEKARIAARVRRSQEASIITEMAHELHITQERLRRIDKTTIIKLAIDYIKAFELLCRGEPTAPAPVAAAAPPTTLAAPLNLPDGPPVRQQHLQRQQQQPVQARHQREHSDDEDENNRNRKHHHHDQQQAPPRLAGLHSRKRPSVGLQAIRQRTAAHQHQLQNQLRQHQPLKQLEANNENAACDALAQRQHHHHQLLQPLQEAAADNQQENRRAANVPQQQQQQHQIEPPSISTASIFEPKTIENANSHYLMIEGSKGDGLASFVLRPDTEVLDEDDLTHLAPQAGDVSIPLDVEPLESIVLDDKTSSLFVGSPGYLSAGSPVAQLAAQLAPQLAPPTYCSAAALPVYPTAGIGYQAPQDYSEALEQRADNRFLINFHGRHDNYYQP